MAYLGQAHGIKSAPKVARVRNRGVKAEIIAVAAALAIRMAMYQVAKYLGKYLGI